MKTKQTKRQYNPVYDTQIVVITSILAYLVTKHYRETGEFPRIHNVKEYMPTIAVASGMSEGTVENYGQRILNIIYDFWGVDRLYNIQDLPKIHQATAISTLRIVDAL